MRAFSRRAMIIGLPLALAACADNPPPRQEFPPLRYGYLNHMPLNVAALDIDNQAVAAPGDIAGLSPVPPATALETMAHDRLQTVGSAGRAVFVIKEASIQRTANGLAGRLRARLEIQTGNGLPAAFAEAQVSRTLTGLTPDLRAAAYDITKQMMADMNVEFEYQVRHSLQNWLVTDTRSANTVQAQPLPPN